MTLPTALYRLYDADGELLYIGTSCDPRARMVNHRTRAWWPLVSERRDEWHQDRDSARAAERAAIQAERPRYNVADTPLVHAICNAPRRAPMTAAEEVQWLAADTAAGRVRLRELSAARGRMSTGRVKAEPKES